MIWNELTCHRWLSLTIWTENIFVRVLYSESLQWLIYIYFRLSSTTVTNPPTYADDSGVILSSLRVSSGVRTALSKQGLWPQEGQRAIARSCPDHGTSCSTHSLSLEAGALRPICYTSTKMYRNFIPVGAHTHCSNTGTSVGESPTVNDADDLSHCFCAMCHAQCVFQVDTAMPME